MLDRKRSLWISMWGRPRETVREACFAPPLRDLWILALLSGWPLVLQITQFSGLLHQISWPALLIGTIAFAPLVGCGCFCFFAACLWLAGKWFNGKSSFKHLFIAVACSNITSLPTCLGWIWVVIRFKEFMFSPNFAGVALSAGEVLILLLFLIWQIVALLWTAILLCVAVDEVQGFASLGKAVLSFAAAVLFSIAALGAVLACIENIISWCLR